jgi:hypothetical protein
MISMAPQYRPNKYPNFSTGVVNTIWLKLCLKSRKAAPDIKAVAIRIPIRDIIELIANILKGELTLTLFNIPKPPIPTFGSTVMEWDKNRNSTKKA